MKNFDDLKMFLTDMNPACVCLQETYLTPQLGEGNEPEIGYSYHRKDLISDGRAHGGVAILVRVDIPSARLYLNTSLQAVAVKIRLHKSITICSLYLPPQEQINKSELDNLFHQLPGNVLVLGDYNAHNVLWNSSYTSTRGRIIEDIVSKNDYIILNGTEATHFNATSLSVSNIDLSIASPSLKQDFEWSVYGELLGSDHYPVLLQTTKPFQSTAERVPKWILRDADWESFLTLSKIERNADTFDSVDEMVMHFEETIIAAARETIPTSSTRPRRIPIPWWNDECKRDISAREKALEKFKNEPTLENRITYAKLKAIARRTVRKAKRDSWREYVNKLNREATSKQVWNRIARIQHKGARDPISILKEGNLEFQSHKEIADHLGGIFSFHSSVNQCSPEFQTYKRQAEKEHLNFQSDSSDPYNEPFSRMELADAIHRAKDSSPGGDGIHYQMLKHLGSDSLDFLLDVYNQIWLRQRFPSTWRRAIIVAILKPGKEANNGNNYRPIALTSCLCKIMERMVNQRLNWFLEYHQLIDRNQCGFRPSRGTIDHLVRLEEEIKRAFLKKQHLLAIFFDIKKAYDTCWKHGILKSLHNFGLRGNLPIFVKNFLDNRTFRVRVGSTLSEEYPQHLGVPQGSVLSPTLFSVMINSVLSALPVSVGKMLYVDDLTIYSSSARLEGAERQITTALRSIDDWTKKTGFMFSPVKSVCVHFHRRRGLFLEPQFSLGGELIPVRTEVRYLGLIFDSRLTWLPHLRNLRLRCSKSLDILRVVSRQAWGADRTVLLRLYRALIRSKIDYGCQAYGSASKTSLKMLDTVHHQALRIVLGAFRTSPVESLYVEAHEPSLFHRRMLLDLQYKMRLQKIPSHPTTILGSDDSLDDRFLRRRREKPPYGVRSRILLRDLGIDMPVIAPLEHKIKPPWKIPDLNICNIYQEVSKKEVTDVEMRQLFLHHQEQCHNGIFIYTDGSKQMDGVGSAMAIPSRPPVRRLQRLPKETSVFNAELNAIKMAVEYFDATDSPVCSIFTDSQSALCLLQHVFASNNIVQRIHALLYKLAQKGRQVYLCWVPAHVGIPGNELADETAKEASQLPVVTELQVMSRDLHPSIRSGVMGKWQQHWSDVQVIPANKLREIKPDIGFWKSGCSLSRLTETRIARLRIGHTYKTHVYLLNGDPRPTCDTCDCDLTVKHILGECPVYAESRREAGIAEFPRCLGKEMVCDQIMDFLRRSGLINDI